MSWVIFQKFHKIYASDPIVWDMRSMCDRLKTKNYLIKRPVDIGCFSLKFDRFRLIGKKIRAFFWPDQTLMFTHYPYCSCGVRVLSANHGLQVRSFGAQKHFAFQSTLRFPTDCYLVLVRYNLDYLDLLRRSKPWNWVKTDFELPVMS